MTRFLLLAAITGMMATMTSRVRAEDVTAFEPLTYTSPSGKELPYRLLTPQELQPGAKYPLVLFLHGAGERGTDNTAQLVHVVQQLAKPELRERYPAFVLAPQCPAGAQWVNVPWGDDSHVMPESPSEPLSLAVELVDECSRTLPVDPDRIYFVGLSMGGFGVWDLLQRYPGRAAGALAICGGGDPAYVQAILKTPVWAFHGDQDGVVKVNRSRQMIHALSGAGAHPIYTEYPGVGHNSWTATAENRLVWDWLFAQSR